MVTLASVLSTLISRVVLGDAPQLAVPGLATGGPGEYLGFTVLGLLAGAAGIGYTHLLCIAEDAGDRFWRGPDWLRSAIGGLPLGLMLLALPQMYGVGDPVQSAVTNGAYGVGFCLLLVVGKAAASSLTIGIGGSGGVFGPCLFIGAALGAAFGETLHAVDPAAHPGPVVLYALVGMGALFGGASRAPLTSVAIVFELTARSAVLLPVLAAVTAAGFASRRLSRGTIYTVRLLRRGVDPEGIGPAPSRTGVPTGPAAIALAALADAAKPTSVTNPVEDSPTPAVS